MKIGDDIAIKCFHPVRAKVGKEYRLFRCGKCPYCMMLRSMDLYTMCMFECMVSKSSYSLTLSYAKEYIPRMVCVPGDSFCSGTYNVFDCSEREDIRAYYSDVLQSDFLGSFCMEDYLYTKMHLKLNTNPRDQYPADVFPYLFPRDIQLFLKRFRKYAKNEGLPNLRYYVVGEYGPLRFRPHWHLQLYFDGTVEMSKVNKVVSQSWRYGMYRLKILQGQYVRYSTKYTTGSFLVSPLHGLQSTRPRVFHSRYFGGQIFDSISRRLAVDETSTFVIPDKVSLGYAGEIKEYWICRQVENRRFPRCVGYAEKANCMRRISYTLYPIAERAYTEANDCPPKSLLDLANFVAQIDYCDSLSPKLDVFLSWYRRSSWLNSIFYSKDFKDGMLRMPESVQKEVEYKLRTQSHSTVNLPDCVWILYRKCLALIKRDSIYRELLISRKFLQLCQQYDKKVDDYLLDIYKYYERKELTLLNKCLAQMEEVSRTSDSYILTYYDNICDEDHLDTIPAFGAYKAYVLDQMLHRRKHRELNDVNDQFCYDLREWNYTLLSHIP